MIHVYFRDYVTKNGIKTSLCAGVPRNKDHVTINGVEYWVVEVEWCEHMDRDGVLIPVVYLSTQP
jgi:hypothetical protein